MPHTQFPSEHLDEAATIVSELLARYLRVALAVAQDSDRVERDRLTAIFASRQGLVIDLVAAGLATGRVPF